MENLKPISLRDLGDWIHMILSKQFSSGDNVLVEMTMTGTSMQETISLKLPDRSHAFLKVFPHKNYLGDGVFRIEVFHTRPGDMRGTRIAFIEVPRHERALEELQRFMAGIMPQLGV